MSESPQIPDYVLVVCYRCGTRMHPTLRATPSETKCPDCYTMNPVPARAEVAAKIAQQKPPEEIGTYRLVIPPDVRDDLESRMIPTPARSDERPDEPRPQTRQPGLRPDWADDDEPLPEPSGPDDWEWDSPLDADDDSPAAPTVEPSGFTVCCPACSATFTPPLTDAPQTVLCPECLEDVPVPSRAEAEAAAPPSRPESKRSTKTPRPPRPTTERTQDVGPVQKTGRGRVESGESLEAGWNAGLPPIPRGDRPARKKKRPRPDTPAPSKKSVAAEETDEPPERNPTVRRDGVGVVFDRMAEVRRAIEDAPAQWTFFSGTLSFPWRSDVLLRWIYLTAGCTAVAFLGALVTLLFQSGSQYGVMAMAFFALPAFWLWLWTLSYAASCGLHIIVETAAGNDRIREWPEPNWKEWAGSLFYVFFQLVVTNVVAYFLGQLIGSLVGMPLLWSGLIAFLLFPVVLLSTMETDNAFLPFSEPILRSFLLFPQGWLIFYVLTGLLTLLLSGAGALAVWHPLLAAVVIGPVEAAYLLIYPRLLGRLAWKASTIAPPDSEETDKADDTSKADRPRKRKKRKRPKRTSPGEAL